MDIALTYDLRSDYLAAGYSDEETAEFDRPDTVEAIEHALSMQGHNVQRVGHVRQLVECLASGRRFDLVFNICEGIGGYGREAQVPALLDAYEIPYTFCDPLLACVSLHKAVAKELLRGAGVATPNFKLIHTIEDLSQCKLEFPVFAKPVAEGTSKGCGPRSLVRSEHELYDICTTLLATFKQPVLVETYLSGREFTVGLLGSGDTARVVGALEVVLLDSAEPGVYSYKNKEQCETLVRYDVANDAIARSACQLALRAWQTIGGRDAGRVDVRCDENNQPMVLEINPIPGLHPQHSDLPILCQKVGIDYGTLIRCIVDSASARRSASISRWAA